MLTVLVTIMMVSGNGDIKQKTFTHSVDARCVVDGRYDVDIGDDDLDCGNIDEPDDGDLVVAAVNAVNGKRAGEQ